MTQHHVCFTWHVWTITYKKWFQILQRQQWWLSRLQFIIGQCNTSSQWLTRRCQLEQTNNSLKTSKTNSWIVLVKTWFLRLGVNCLLYYPYIGHLYVQNIRNLFRDFCRLSPIVTFTYFLINIFSKYIIPWCTYTNMWFKSLFLLACSKNIEF